MTDLKAIMMKLDLDPKFQQLSAGAQSQVKAQVFSTELSKDEDFLKLEPQAQAQVITTLVDTPPSLQNKQTQMSFQNLVQRAQQGDISAKATLAGMVGSHAVISNSLIAGYFGTKIIAPAIAAEKNVARTPELENSEFWSADPRDRAKMADYAEYTLKDDAKYARRAGLLKIFGTVLPTIAETLLMTLPTAGTSAAPVALGRLAVKPAARLGAAAMVKGSQWGVAMAKVLGGVSHATVTAGIGVVRENVLELIRGNAADAGFQDTIKKNAKWFGGYFLWDAVGNVALDTVLPMLKGMTKAFRPRAMGQNAGYFKGIAPEDLTKIIGAYLSGKDVDPYLLARLPEPIQLAMDNMRIAAAVNNNLPAATEKDVFTFLANTKGFMANHAIDGSTAVALRASATEDAFVHFKDYKAGIAYMVNNWDAPGMGRTVKSIKSISGSDPKLTWKGKAIPEELKLNFQDEIYDAAAAHKLSDFEYDGVPLGPQNFTPSEWTAYLRQKNIFGDGDFRRVALREFDSNTYLTKKYGIDPLKDKEGFADAVLRRNGMDPDEVDVLWDPAAFDRFDAYAYAADYSVHTQHKAIKPNAKYRVDFGGMFQPGVPEEFTNSLGVVVEHEVQHLLDMRRGWWWYFQKSANKQGREAHHAFYHIFDADAVHEYAVKQALGDGYQVPYLAKHYPDLVAYQFRPQVLRPEEVPVHAAASRQVEIRRVLRSSGNITDEKRLAALAKLVSPDPATMTYNRENLEKFAKEYMRLSGAKESTVNGVTVRLVHSKAVAEEGASVAREDLLQDATLQFRRHITLEGADKDTLTIPLKLKDREYVREIVAWLDADKAAYPTKAVGAAEFRVLKKAGEWKMKLNKLEPGTWDVEASVPIGKGNVGYEFARLTKGPEGWTVTETRRAFNKATRAIEVLNLDIPKRFARLKHAQDYLQEYLEGNVLGIYAKGKLQNVVRHTGSLPEDVFAGLEPTATPKTLGAHFDEVATRVFGPPKRITKTLSEKGFLAKYPRMLGQQKIFSPEWVDWISERIYGTKPKLDPATEKWYVQVLSDPTDKASAVSRNLTFNTREELARNMIADTVDEPYMKIYLNEQNLGLRKNVKTNAYEVFQRNAPDDVLVSDKTLKDLLVNNPDLMPKIPHDMGPEITIAVPSKIEATFKGGAYIGTPEDVLKELDKYENRAIAATKKVLGSTKQGYLIADTASKTYEVHIPSLGDRRVFATIEEAKDWLTSGHATLENLQESAMRKGQRIWADSGKWVLYDSTGTARTYQDLDAVKEALAKTPIPSWMPELSGMPSELVEPNKKILFSGGQFPPPIFEVKPNQTKLQLQMETLNQFISSPEGWLTRHVAKGGDPALLNGFRKLEDLRLLVRGQDNRLNQIAHTLFLDESGKRLMKSERRLFIGEWLRASGEDAKKAVVAARGLTDYEVGVGQRVRELWGTAPGKGLHGRYLGLGGGTGIQFLEDYLPKMNKYYLSHKSMKYADGDMKSLLRDVFGGNAPRELDAFFLHQRVQDTLTLLDEDDPLMLLVKYGKIGNRKFLLGPYWEEAMKLTDESADTLGAARLRYYMADVMGLPQSQGEAIMKNASLEALRKFGVNKGMGEDLLRFFMGVGYISALGARPMLAVRNMMQIWTTLAPSLGADGNKWVNMAVKKVAGDSTGQIFDALRAKGLFMADVPVAGGEMFAALGPEGMVGKFFNAGMKWYRNSDEFSRAVGYWAARMKFEKASEVFRAGMTGKGPAMTEHAFLEMSGLRATDPTFIDATMKLVKEGNWVSAADSFASKMTTWTMFPYWSGMSPMAFRGTVGKLFGMMGHYPVYYVENVRRAMKFGSTASKLGFMATWAFNSAALYGAFSMAGMQAKDFLPWQPFQFAGGPYFQLGYGMLQSLTSGYKGRQARAELFGLTTSEGKLEFHPEKGSLYKWFIPFGYEMSALAQAWKFADEGRGWAAFLTATGGRPTPYWTGEQ